jgi:UDP-GlcNAc:undecaprenyl-phosphate GlcNAc-1-phosphate transferase
VRDFLMVGIVAAAVGILLAPLVQHFAMRTGFVDRPDKHHKRHRRAVPLGGGMLVFISTMVGLVSVTAISPVVRMLFARDAVLARGLLLSSLILLFIGLLDDRRGMRGRHKLLGQIVAALVLTNHGLEIRQLELLGWTFDLGVMAVPFTVFWLLGSINAMNLLDGLDGLLGTVGLTTSLVVAVIAIISGQPFAALLAVAIAGATAAFLNANLPPARMFLGDAGSLLLGLMLGALTVLSCSKGAGLLSVAPAVAVLTIPIMDSAFALLRRRLTGRSIYATDRGHFHHCLMQELGRHRSVLLVTGLACLASGTGAAISVYSKNDATALLTTAMVVGLLIVFRTFGYVECTLLLRKLSARLSIRRGTDATRNKTARKIAVRLQGERQWDLLWESLTELGQRLDLLRIDLDVNLPALKEGFHANWYQLTPLEWHECWRMELPLFVDGVAVGRLAVAGEREADEGSVCDAVDRLTEFLKPFEMSFMELAAAPVAIGYSNRNKQMREATQSGEVRSVPRELVASATDPREAVGLRN